MDLDVVLLSRIQFALTVMFHYLFPPLTIGMGLILVYLDGRWLFTRDDLYRSAAKFWTGLFALNFAIGVASGIVMEFQFGTNWATYSRFVGDVFGAALAAEGIFAFFLESGFLAVLVFGWDRVGPRMHFFSTCMVALGSIFSSVWIVVANSWQQTPAGHHVVPLLDEAGNAVMNNGLPVMRAEVVDFWQVVFNPSTAHRLTHVLIGCFIMGAFFVLSISAWYILKKRHEEFARHSFRGALILATIASLAALVSGHFNADMVYEHQPAKMAAFEGHYQTGRGDLSLFGIPDDENETLRGKIAIPGGLSFLLHFNFTDPVMGLDKFRPEDRPPTLIPFASYHLMIGLGTFFIVLTLFSCILWRKGTLFNHRWLLWIYVLSVLGAIVANQAGWIAAEVGRQPWIVQPPVQWNADGSLVTGPDGFVAYDNAVGLRTADAVSVAVKDHQVLGSIVMFSLIYLLLAMVWIFVLNHKIQKGPQPPYAAPPPGHERFLRAAADSADKHDSMTEAHGEKSP